MKRINVKKLAAFALALCMCAAVAGCGDSGKTEEQQIEEKLESITEDEINEQAEKLEGAEGGDAETTTTAEPEPEPVEFDPFEYLEVSYDGISPYANVKLSAKGGSPSSVVFNADKTNVVGNGDTITVTAKLSLDNGDYVLTKDTNTYTVEGLSEYLMSLDELPEDVDEKLRKQADDLLTADVAGWRTTQQLDESSYLGNYFLTIKTDGNYGSGNRLFYVYDIKASVDLDKDGSYEKDFDFIWAAYIDDVYKLEDGTWVFDTSSMKKIEKIINTVDNGIGYPTFNGYDNIDSFFSKEIASHIDDSNYETNIE